MMLYIFSFNPFTIILVEFEEQAEMKAGLATGTPSAKFKLFFFHFPHSFSLGKGSSSQKSWKNSTMNTHILSHFSKWVNDVTLL